MPAIKLTGFKGIAPKVSPELLQDQAAQTAHNCKLYSGDLIPYPEPVVNSSTGRTGATETIYPLRDPDTNDIVWLSWDTEVNVATPSFSSDLTEQRFYYTGDGIPKVSTFALATDGVAPFPDNYYALGLPLPKTKITVTPSTFTSKTTASVSRDAGGMVTINTSTDHELRTGNIVAVSGFSYITGSYSRSGTTNTITISNHGLANGSSVLLTRTSGGMTDGVYTIFNVSTNTFDVTDPESGSASGNVRVDIRSYNTTNSEITVVDDNTFTFFAPGFQQSTYTITDGKVDLAGDAILRTYVYTWFTPWGEESIASEPSEDIIAREGITVTLSDLPTTAPTEPANNFIRGIRVYRTLSSETDADYFRLKTLWFPQSLETVSRTGNVSRVRVSVPHNFIEDDRFKIASATNASFNITDGIVTEIVDDYTFEYNQAGVDVAETAEVTAVLYHDAAEDDEHDARYWADGSYDFTDDFDARFLTEILTSDEYEAPPEDLAGLKTIQNNILCGFTGNKLRFSEPDFPHAWPIKYEKTLDYNIVAVEPISAIGAIVLTEGYPYLVSGSDPDIMSVQRVDALYPCVSSRGVVSMSYGVVYPTNEGLAVYSPSSGPRLITNPLYEQDTWSSDYEPSTIKAEYYGDAYFASHSTGSFIYQYDSQSGGSFVTCDQTFDAAHNDKETNRFYFVDDDTGNVLEWDDLGQPAQTMEWKSKVIVTKDYINLGAARVIADYGDTWDNWEDIGENWEDLDTDWDAGDNITFKLFVNKNLIFTRTLSNSQPFRLPTGYRSDTFEFSVSGDVRVRAVHLAETVFGLKEA